jgi:ABC-2 type transport system permease protein
MRNVWVVLKREYLERVRTRAFLLTTLLLPLFMGAVMILPSKLASMKSSAVRRVAVVASSPDFAARIQHQLDARSKQLGTRFLLEAQTDGSPAAIARLQQRVAAKELDGYLLVTDKELEAGKAVYAARRTSDFVESASLESAVSSAMTRQRLASRGLNNADIDSLFPRIDLDTITLAGGRQSRGNALVTLLASVTMMMMMYMTVILYGIAVMRAVLEEKTSRVVEVMLASVTPKEMMAGKILGVGAVGVTQIVIWWIMAALLFTAGLAGGGAAMSGLELGSLKLGYFLVFFLLGYFLYATLWAALGAMVNSEQEAQQMQFIVMLPLILSTVVMILVIRQPNSPLAVWMSFVPFCTPLIMYLRIVVQEPPFWQIALSFALTVATTYALVALCSRIYRVGILMYGKRPTLPEILKWIKYA